MPLSIVTDSLKVYNIPYPKLRRALSIVLPLELNKQKHPKLLPTKEVWTERQRALISNIVDKPNRQATTFKSLQRLVRDGLFHLFSVLTLCLPDRLVLQGRHSPERQIHTSLPQVSAGVSRLHLCP